LAELNAHVGGDAPGAAVRDPSGAVDRAEVAAGGDVARAKIELDAERFEHAASDLEAHGVVTEQAQVTGAAARRDAGPDVAKQAARGFRGERAEVRNARGLELGASRLGPGKAAKPVQREQHDFRRIAHHQRADEIEHDLLSVPEAATPPSPGCPSSPACRSPHGTRRRAAKRLVWASSRSRRRAACRWR